MFGLSAALHKYIAFAELIFPLPFIFSSRYSLLKIQLEYFKRKTLDINMSVLYKLPMLHTHTHSHSRRMNTTKWNGILYKQKPLFHASPLDEIHVDSIRTNIDYIFIEFLWN